MLLSDSHPFPLPPLVNPSESDLWSEEEIYACSLMIDGAASRANPFMATIWDLRLRRYYLVVAFRPEISLFPSQDDLENPYWTDVLKKCSHRTKSYTEFNTIRVQDDGSFKFSFTPLFDFVVPISPLSPPPDDNVLRIRIDDLSSRQYLAQSVESCILNGQNVVFKQILRPPESHRLQTEISVLNQMRESPLFPSILAYVVDDEQLLRGIILPFAGHTIDSPVVQNLTWTVFRDILKGLHELDVQGLQHHDIASRNILVFNAPEGEQNITTVIDPGNEGLDYQGDGEELLQILRDPNLREKVVSKQDIVRLDLLVSKMEQGMDYKQILDEVV